MLNHIENFAKYAGIATVSVEWLALLLYYLKMPAYFDGQHAISTFASLPQTRLIFNICYTLAAIFFWIFIRHHLHKYYRTPVKIIGLSMILFIGLAITPYSSTIKQSVLAHGILGWSSAVLFVTGFYQMAKNTKDKSVYRGSMLTIFLSIILIMAFALSPKNSHFIFAFEAGSWLVWQIWVLWITFYSFKHKL